MGTGALVARSTNQTVEANDVNQYRDALRQDLVPRNASGSAEDGAGDLGTGALQWGNIYFSGNLIQGGQVVDLSKYVTESHRILSGAEASGGGGYPEFLAAVGGAATGRILGATTSLSLVINNNAVTVSSNVDVTGLTLAPSSNNTCAVNDAALSGAAATKHLGENGESVTIDAIGSEISALDGTVQAFKKGNEYFLALVDTGNNRLFPFMRGACRSTRETLADNDTITLMSANYIFIAENGTSTYKTTMLPTFEATDPGSPASNQWYFDCTNKRWKQYAGSWTITDVAWLGFVICNSSEAVAAHSNDFDLVWDSSLEGQMELVDAASIRVRLKRIHVAGVDHFPRGNGQVIQLSDSGDRESGVSEAASTRYYIYCDKTLKLRLSNIAPRRPDHRRGMYHPSRYWRYIGYADNDAGSDLVSVKFNGYEHDFTPTPNVRTTVRNAVLNAHRDSNGDLDYFDAGTGLAVDVDTTTPIDVSFAYGWNEDGEVNFHGRYTSDFSISSLPSSSTVYLYLSRSIADGTLSGGFSTIKPTWSFVAPATPSNGQPWFDLGTGKMREYSTGTTSWVEKQRVYIGEADTDGSGVTAVRMYPINVPANTGYILLQDQKASGTAGGTFTSGAWRTRDLNTEVIDTGAHCSLAANQFTLRPGTYRIRATVPAFGVSNAKAKLYNVTDAVDVLFSHSIRGADSTTCTVVGEFTITKPTAFEIQHQCSSTQASNGFGYAVSFGTEIYTQVELWRVE